MEPYFNLVQWGGLDEGNRLLMDLCRYLFVCLCALLFGWGGYGLGLIAFSIGLLIIVFIWRRVEFRCVVLCLL